MMTSLGMYDGWASKPVSGYMPIAAGVPLALHAALRQVPPAQPLLVIGLPPLKTPPEPPPPLSPPEPPPPSPPLPPPPSPPLPPPVPPLPPPPPPLPA